MGDIINNLNAIRNEGKWIIFNDDVNKIHYKECRYCKVRISFNLPSLNYCPNCGHDMIYEVKSNDTRTEN